MPTPVKVLIAIITCHKFKDRADAQRATWIKDLVGLPNDFKIDHKFFLGRGARTTPEADEVFLDVDDKYETLPYKVRAAFQWAVANGYNTVLKCDDDAIVLPERLMHKLPRSCYVGRLNNSMHHIAPFGWCSGFAYWLTTPALQIIANAPDPDHTAEDLWVGKTLSKHNIRCEVEPGFIVLHLLGTIKDVKNQVIAGCEFPGPKMFEIYDQLRDKYTEPSEPPKPRIFQYGKVIPKPIVNPLAPISPRKDPPKKGTIIRIGKRSKF